jgi:hypothetical protein
VGLDDLRQQSLEGLFRVIVVLTCVFSPSLVEGRILWPFPKEKLGEGADRLGISCHIERQGDALAVWFEEGHSVPSVAYYDRSQHSWQRPWSISPGEDSQRGVMADCLIQSWNQNIWVIWSQNDRIYARIRKGGIWDGVWEPDLMAVPYSLQGEGGGRVSALVATGNAEGVGLLAWVETKPWPVRDIVRCRRFEQGQWIPPLHQPPFSMYDDRVSDTFQPAPSLAMDAEGNTALVFRCLNRIALRTYLKGGWEPPLDKPPLWVGPEYALSPTLAMGPLGCLWISWVRHQEVEATLFRHGHSDSIVSMGYGSGPQLRSDGKEVAHLIWSSEGERVLASSWKDGRWSCPQLISTIGAEKPEFCLDPVGNGTAVWKNKETKSLEVADLYRGVWQTPISIPVGQDEVFVPSLALGSHGSTFVSWVTDRGIAEAALCLKETSSIYPVEFPKGTIENPLPPVSQVLLELGDPPLPPTRAYVQVLKNDFGAFYERVHHITWEASPDERVWGYQVFVDNVLVGQVHRSQRHCRLHNRLSKQVNYDVRAIHSYGLQSHPTPCRWIKGK